MPSFGESAKEVYKAMLKYGPKLSKMEWEALQKYLPLQAQLALQLSGQYLPQQYAMELGQLGEYMPQFQQLYQQFLRSDRESELADALGLTPRVQELQRTVEGPQLSEMRDLLKQQILGDLRAGEQLTPEQERGVGEYMRTSEIARGLGGGQGSANREAVAKALAGRKVQAERQSRASTLLGQEAGQRYDPFQAILGRSATSMGMGQQALSSPALSPNLAGQTPNPLAAGFSLGNLAQGQQQMGLQSSQFNAQMAQQQSQYNLGLQLAQAQLMATAPKMAQYMQGYM